MKALSKLMSFALRHRPDKFGLVLDEEGWVNLEKFGAKIAAQRRWRWVTLDHIREVVEQSDKRRFEIKAGLIRARYGHSRAARPVYKAVEPPEILYHGTPRQNLTAIRQHGLKAMSRQYVHLSATPKMAVQVGQRRDKQPLILRIRAREAYAAGITFGTPSGQQDDNIYLVESVPPNFITFPEA